MPEEPTGGGNQKETAEERLETRLNRLEQEVLKENRWWRGGLIGAFVLVALAILIAGHHRRPERMAMAPMGMAGWAGSAGMPYGGYGPPCGPAPEYGWGPRPWGGQPREWGVPNPQVPQGQPPPPNR